MSGLNYCLLFVFGLVIAQPESLKNCKNIWVDSSKCRSCANQRLNGKSQLIIDPNVGPWCTISNLKRCMLCIHIFPNTHGKQQISPRVPFNRKAMVGSDSDLSIISFGSDDLKLVISSPVNEFELQSPSPSVRGIRSVDEEYSPVVLSNSKFKPVVPSPSPKSRILIPYIKGPKSVRRPLIVSALSRRHHKHVFVPDFDKYISDSNGVLDMSAALVKFLYKNSKLVEVRSSLGVSSTIAEFLNLLVDFKSPEVQSVLSRYARTEMKSAERALMFAEFTSGVGESDLESYLEYPGVRDKLLKSLLNLSSVSDLVQLMRLLMATSGKTGLVSTAVSELITRHPGYVASFVASTDYTNLSAQLGRYGLQLTPVPQTQSVIL